MNSTRSLTWREPVDALCKLINVPEIDEIVISVRPIPLSASTLAENGTNLLLSANPVPQGNQYGSLGDVLLKPFSPAPPQ